MLLVVVIVSLPVIFSDISRLTVRIRHFILPFGISFFNLSSELIRLSSLKVKVKDCLDQNKNLVLSNELIKVELPP